MQQLRVLLKPNTFGHASIDTGRLPSISGPWRLPNALHLPLATNLRLGKLDAILLAWIFEVAAAMWGEPTIFLNGAVNFAGPWRTGVP